MNRHSLPAAVIVPSILVATPAVASTSIAAAMQDADEFTARPPTSWYVRASGMAIDQQDAALRDRTAGNVIESALTMAGLPSSGWELESDTGFGLTIAAGHRLEQTPISFELEYSYRDVDFDRVTASGLSASAGGDGSTHALMLNVLADWRIGYGPLGVYLGGGIGLAYTEADLRSLDGAATGLASDSDTTFAWQAMAGLTWSVNERTQLYGGVRYFDAGDVDFATSGAENASVGYELGLRFFF